MPRVSSSGSASPAPAPSPTQAARAWAEAVDFASSSLRRQAVARTKAPTTGPAPVQDAFALYRTWQENDLGNARLFRVPLGASTGWAVHATTDGDDGFLELFDGRGTPLASGVTTFAPGGQRVVQWDSTFGAVRERVAPFGVSSSVADFRTALAGAAAPGSTHGTTVDVAEARAAARIMVGGELTTRSIDGFESAALHRVLADDAPQLTHGARSFVSSLGTLYLENSGRKVRKVKEGAVLTGTSAFAQAARLASAEVAGRKSTPHAAAFLELSRSAWSLLPTQVVPATLTEARAALVAAGATTAEAKAAVARLDPGTRALFVGRLYDAAVDGPAPAVKGAAVFAASADGKQVAGVYAPQASAAPPADGGDARSIIAGLTGVDREVQVLDVDGGVSRLRWAPSWGGEIRARLTVPADGSEPVVDQVTVPAVSEPPLAALLGQHLAVTHGATQVMGWVGRDDASGPGFIVAHRPGGQGPARLDEVRIHLGGATSTVTAKPLGAADSGLARDLALVLARRHAQDLVASPEMSDGARLEVALRTGWAQPSALQAQDSEESAVGFDPATERFQFMLPSVWGDNAVFVTFAQDGTLRVEDFN